MPKTPKVCPKVSILGRISNFIHNLSRTVTALIILVTIIIVFVISYRSFRAYAVTIESFNVPSSIEAQGYNGRVMANKLIDQINNIRVYSQEATSIDSPVFTPSWVSEGESVKIPGAGISFDYIMRQIGKFFGCKTIVVTNDTYIENGVLNITTRINNNSARTFGQKSGENLDDFLFRVAEYVSKYTQPVPLAAYYYAKEDYDDSLSIIQYVLNNKPEDDDSLAYVLWGDVLLKEGESYSDVIAKYQEAIELNPKNYQAYSDWGNVLYEQGNYEEAIVKYERAVDLAPETFAPGLNLGLAYEKIGDFDKAAEQYTEVMENVEETPLSIFLRLAHVYTSQGEEEKAVEVLAGAIEKDETLKEEVEEEFETLEASPAFQEIIKP